MSDEPQDREVEIIVREIPRVDDDVCRTGNHREQMVDEPALSCEERRMGRAREPLGEPDDCLEPRLARRHCEGNGALNHIRVPGRAVIGARRSLHSAEQLVWIEEVDGYDLRTALG